MAARASSASTGHPKDVPFSKAIEYRRRFSASLVDLAFVSTDTEAHVAQREQRDRERSNQPLNAKQALLDRCYLRVEKLSEVAREEVAPDVIVHEARRAAAEILAAARLDPAGSLDFTDVLSQVGDILEGRVETQFECPDVWDALALLYGRNGELRAAQKLLDCTIVYVTDLISAGHGGDRMQRHLVVAQCAKSDLCAEAGKNHASLLAIRHAWDAARQTCATYQLFVIRRYRKLLRSQQRPREVATAMARLERRLAKQTEHMKTDWILGWI